MPITVTRKTQLEKPVDVAFASVANYRTIGEWLVGISTFTPTTEIDYGLHAVFEGHLNLGVTTLKSTVKVIGFDENDWMELDSIKGFQNRSKLIFTPTPDGNCSVEFDLTYELPGGVLGKGMGKAIEPLIAQVVKHSSDKLAKQVSAL